MARPEYEPNEKHRIIVEAMSWAGTPQPIIAEYLGISKDTIAKYYRKELDFAKYARLAKVADCLYLNATVNNCTTSQIFIMKCQGGWRENGNFDAYDQPINAINLTYKEPPSFDEFMEKMTAEESKE